MSRSSRFPASMRATRPRPQRRVAAASAAAPHRSTAPAGRGRTPVKGGGKPVDVFDAKADAIAVLEACGVPMAQCPVRSRPSRLVSSRPLGDGSSSARRSCSALSGSSTRRPWTPSTSPGRFQASRSYMRCHAGAEEEDDPHQAGTGAFALPGSQTRLRLRRRQGGRGSCDRQGGVRRRPQNWLRPSTSSTFRRRISRRGQEVG